MTGKRRSWRNGRELFPVEAPRPARTVLCHVMRLKAAEFSGKDKKLTQLLCVCECKHISKIFQRQKKFTLGGYGSSGNCWCEKWSLCRSDKKKKHDMTFYISFESHSWNKFITTTPEYQVIGSFKVKYHSRIWNLLLHPSRNLWSSACPIQIWLPSTICFKALYQKQTGDITTSIYYTVYDSAFELQPEEATGGCDASKVEQQRSHGNTWTQSLWRDPLTAFQ